MQCVYTLAVVASTDAESECAFLHVCHLQPSHMHACLKPTYATVKPVLCMCAEACFVHVRRTLSAPRSCPRTLCPTKSVVRSQGCPAPPKVHAMCLPAATNQHPEQSCRCFGRAEGGLCRWMRVSHALRTAWNLVYPSLRTLSVDPDCPNNWVNYPPVRAAR